MHQDVCRLTRIKVVLQAIAADVRADKHAFSMNESLVPFEYRKNAWGSIWNDFQETRYAMIEGRGHSVHRSIDQNRKVFEVMWIFQSNLAELAFHAMMRRRMRQSFFPTTRRLQANGHFRFKTRRHSVGVRSPRLRILDAAGVCRPSRRLGGYYELYA